MRSYWQLIRHSGNAALFDSTGLSLLAALAGWPLHLHVEGLRGTGKTTIIRSVKNILPRIPRVMGCRYNCDPDAPHCPDHFGMQADELAAVGSEHVRVPFLEISHSAKVGTVVGSIDLQRLTAGSGPDAALLPGTLAQAHRGIVFVDEINRLADTSPELTDVLLDAMGTRPGRLQIEETGIATVEVPLQVTVWAASNPDEDPGPLEDIRRQLADRFDLQATMGRIRSRDVLLDILDGQGHEWPPAPAALGATTPGAGACRYGDVLARRATRLAALSMPDGLRQTVADLYLECGLESLRTVEALQLAARATCAMRNGDEVSLDDLRRAVPLVVGKRADAETVTRFLARLTPAGKDPVPAQAGRLDGGSAASRSGWPTAPAADNQVPDNSPSASAMAQLPTNPGETAAATARAPSRAGTVPQPTLEVAEPGEDTLGQNVSRSNWFAKLVSALTGGGGLGTERSRAQPSRVAAGASGQGPSEAGPGWIPTAPPQKARRLGEVPAAEILRSPGSRAGCRE